MGAEGLVEIWVEGKALEWEAKQMYGDGPEHLWITFLENGRGRAEAFVRFGVLYELKTYVQRPIEVKLREGITEITGSAIRENLELVKISLPRSLACLGKGAFSGCEALKEVEGLEDTGIEILPESCFEGCARVTSLRLPGSLRKIGSFALKGTALTQLELPEGVEVIGKSSFPPTITRLVLPDSLKEVESRGLGRAQEIECSAKGLGLALEGTDYFLEPRPYVVRLPDGRKVKLVLRNYDPWYTYDLCDALKSGTKEDMLNYVKDKCSFKLVGEDFFFTLESLAEELLEGEAKEEAEKFLRKSSGTLASRLYRGGKREPALAIIRKWKVSPKVLDSLLKVANERGDTAFAAILMEEKEMSRANKKRSSFPL